VIDPFSSEMHGAMREIRTYHDVVGGVDEDVVAQVGALQDRLSARLSPVQRIVVVASGKGGVGKSAVAANLAALLADTGARVGAVDADLSGPSLARMLGARAEPCQVAEDGVHPAAGAHGVRVMSMDLLVEDETPLRWRDPPGGPAPEFLRQSLLETGALREFLADTVWGPLDYLIIDAPPGTDKIVRLLQLLPRIDLLLLVTTPAEIARFVVAKAVRLAVDAGVTQVGLVANMTTHVCTACGHSSPLFDADGAHRLADSANVPLWAEVPFDARVAAFTDAGRPFALVLPETAPARELRRLAARVAAVPPLQQAAPS
jgi:ATP-binding protein involved in chromosome partitioning